MNRRLHNTMSASVAVGALLLLGLAFAVPAPSAHAPAGATAAHAGAALVAPLAATSGGGPRRHRQRLVMPFFSFSRN